MTRWLWVGVIVLIGGLVFAGSWTLIPHGGTASVVPRKPTAGQRRAAQRAIAQLRRGRLAHLKTIKVYGGR